MKLLLNIVLALMLAAFAAGAAIFLEIRIFADTPVEEQPMEKTVKISPGQSFSAVIGELSRADMAKHPLKLKLFARFMGYDKRIKAGEYRLSTGMSPRQILEKLASSDVLLYRITIPEGYNLSQIAEVVENGKWGDADDFLAAARDETFVKKFGFNAKTFEGYLFPETYYFPKTADIPDIITAMATRFKSIFRPEWEKIAADKGFTVHQIVTLASIIEKETGVASERPMISSVFHNRLKKGMRLESDPTVIYGISDYNGNITRKHLRTATPYNTYQIKGLPPGPIASPGLASIEAALFPAETNFLYFVSRKDKTHQFSSNIRDHNRAVRRYQLRRKKAVSRY